MEDKPPSTQGEKETMNIFNNIQTLVDANVDWSMMAGPIWLIGGIIVAGIFSVLYVRFGGD